MRKTKVNYLIFQCFLCCIFQLFNYYRLSREKNILNLTFEGYCVSALAVWWYKLLSLKLIESMLRSDLRSGMILFSHSGSIKIIKNILICTFCIDWMRLLDLIKVITFCYTTRVHAIAVVTKPRHRVVITRHIPHILSRYPRRHEARDNPRLIWWNQSGIAIWISQSPASRNIHHQSITIIHLVHWGDIRITLRYYCLPK